MCNLGQGERENAAAAAADTKILLAAFVLQVGPDAYAMVPFLDVANHAGQPNADFRVNKAAGAMELFAVTDIPAGQEVTISYTGDERSPPCTHGLFACVVLGPRIKR